VSGTLVRCLRVAGFASCLLLVAGCDQQADERVIAQSYAYPPNALNCPRAIPVAPAPDGQLLTADKLEVLVRVPVNYRAEIAHPLLVVFAAAGMTPTASERLTGFTPPATRAGYVVAYARHIRPSRAAIRKLARVPATVGAQYCIDESQIYVSGHSDGGTTATALAVQPATTSGIAGLAPSAAGFNGQDLAEFACPAPRPVLIWHGARDRLFPGWGREAATWWAQCNQCEPTARVPHEAACIRYTGCAQPVHYCAGAYGHTSWPPAGAAQTIVFFEATKRHP
jgi:polyhydroxybutyrate depolymerase